MKPTAIPGDYRGHEPRYLAVRDEIAKLPRPCTVLDFGAHNGSFSVRLAQDLGCEVLAVDEHHQISAPGVKSLKRRVGAGGIEELGRFDVVLAMSVLHHFGDWRRALTAFRRIARRVLIVEAPHPDEVLTKPAARHELAAIHAFVRTLSVRTIGHAPATRQPNLRRPTFVVPPLLTGHVFSGGGHHSRTQERYGDEFEATLGYRPYAGSLNLQLDRPADLGVAQAELFWPPRRRYRLWRGRLPMDPWIPCHVMDVGKRGHGPDWVELLAPVCLRETLRLEDENWLVDGSPLEVEVIW